MNVDEAKNLIASLRQSDPSLINLQGVCDKLESFLEAVTVALDLSAKIDGLTSQIQQFKAVNRDLNERMGNVETVLKTQQDQLFISDQEHKAMIRRVSTVLNALEDYLRRHS